MVTFKETLAKLERYRAEMKTALEHYTTGLSTFKELYERVDQLSGFADDATEACTEQFSMSSSLDHISMTLASFDDGGMGEAEFAEELVVELDAPWAWQEEA